MGEEFGVNLLVNILLRPQPEDETQDETGVRWFLAFSD